MKFRPDIEGLRAAAVVPVVLYHANSTLVSGGYVGVDVFFVISGFLISKIIFDGIDGGTFSYSTFYRRRISRIFPALFFMLSVVSVAALFILPPVTLQEFGNTLAATALFVSNIEFGRLSGYFDGAAGLKPLLHTWSLAVEEQFYIFFPIVLTVTKRWLGGHFIIVILACAAVSLLISIRLVMHDPNSAFYSGPSRAFELMVGAVLALNTSPQLSNRIAREIIAAVGMAMIATSVFAFDQTTPFPGLSALLPCLGAAAIIYSGQSGQSAIGTFLSLPAVRFIGAISYSLYLWHWPVLALARNYFMTAALLTPLQTISAVLLAVALAVISWRFVEAPFRLRAQRNGPIFGLAAASMAGAMAISFAIVLSAGFPSRFPAESLRLFRYSGDFNHLRKHCHSGLNHFIPYSSNCYFGTRDAQDVVTVWGDSHGAELSVALGRLVGPGRSVMEITSSGCPPALDFDTPERPGCAAQNRETIINLLRDRRVHTVILVAKYSHYDLPLAWQKFKSGLEKAISELASSGKRVILVYPIPVYPYPVPDAVGMMVARGIPPDRYRLALTGYRQMNAAPIAELNSITAKFHIQGVVTEKIFCGLQDCRTYNGYDVLYYDDNHLSVSGASELAAAIRLLL